MSTVILVGVADNVQSYNRKRCVNSNPNSANAIIKLQEALPE